MKKNVSVSVFLSLLLLIGGGVDGVADKHDDGHGSASTGHRRDPRRMFGRFVKLDVTDESIAAFGSGVIDRIDADVDDDRSRSDPMAANESGASTSGHDNVGATNVLLQVACTRVARGHRAVRAQQQQPDGLTDDITASHHCRQRQCRASNGVGRTNSVFAVEWRPSAPEHVHDATGGARKAMERVEAATERQH